MLLIILALARAAAGPDATPVYKSPQAVFDGSLAATKTKDFKAAVECIAPEARREAAGMMAYNALVLRRLDLGGLEALKAVSKALAEVMDRHGLTEKATAGVLVEVNPAADAVARQRLAKMVKKPEAFLVEMMAARDRASKGRMGVTTGKLSDVKTDGDRAAGVVTTEQGGKTLRQKISFVKKANGWRIIPSYERPEVAGGAGKDGKGKDR
jgi:hypothetical protein